MWVEACLQHLFVWQEIEPVAGVQAALAAMGGVYLSHRQGF